MSDLFSERGQDVNPVKIGGRTDLLGDPAVKLEKPHTIVCFPGGHVEIARTTDGHYWVHVAVRNEISGGAPGRIVRARLDAKARYADAANAVLNQELAAADVEHIAFLVAPGTRA